jgi:hypothetical protein
MSLASGSVILRYVSLRRLLKIRPIHHWLEGRVRAHVFLCKLGVSTRKVKAITEELCGHGFSASAISDATARLDGALKAARSPRIA